MSEKRLVVGLGNTLLRDEGIGVRCVEYLRGRGLGDGIKLLEGATLGFDLLDEIEGFEKVLIVDAVDMGKEPGHIASFDAENLLSLSSSGKFSLHEMGLVEILQVAKRIGYDFSNVRIVGIQPQDVSRGDGLSEVIETRLPALAERVLKEIADEKGG